MERDYTEQRHAWALLLTTHARLTARVEAALAEAGLPEFSWYDMLWSLETVEGGRLRMHELAERVVLSRSNLSRLADRLERAALIRREPCADDRRGYYCVITRAGRKMRRTMWPVYRKAIDDMFSSHIDAADARRIAACFMRLLEAARRRDA